MRRANVVFPEPGGPQKMHDPTSPRRISSPSALPGPSRCSWPRKSSSVVGLIRAASGSGEPWNRVGSVTIEMRDAGCGMRETKRGMLDAGCVETAPARGNRVVLSPPAPNMLIDVRKLQRLDTWRIAQDLAYQAYL